MSRFTRKSDEAPVSLDGSLAQLAERYCGAQGTGMRILTAVGTQADLLIDGLPEPVRRGLEDGTAHALRVAVEAAGRSHGRGRIEPGWAGRAVGTALGAAGGAGGMAGTLAELPFTTTLLLRAIQREARLQGFEPRHDDVRDACLRVFCAAGPLAQQDSPGADLSFMAARVSLSSAASRTLFATVIPRLSTVLGQKLATQAVPLLGAISGASANYIYMRYYQDLAHVRFGLHRLALDFDESEPLLIERLREQISMRM